MNWTEQVDGYCERLGPAYWAEPVNALTNLAFILAALVMWRRCRGPGMASGRVMAAILFVIGVGSWLFHTHATAWAGLADVLPIAVFVVAYIHLANRDYWRLKGWRAVMATVSAFALVPLTAPLFAQVPGLAASAAYAPIPCIIAGYALALRRRLPEVARGLGIGAALLAVSIAFRSMDMPLCDGWPLGTHFMWHLLNALMLGWMIEVWRRWRLTHPV